MAKCHPSRWVEMYAYMFKEWNQSEPSLVVDIILAASDMEGNFLVVKVRIHNTDFQKSITPDEIGIPIYRSPLLYAA